MSTPFYDVIIVGYGPVGAVLANRLGHDGLRVLVVEQMAGIYDKPRAINIDHEVMRALQSVGLADRVEPTTILHPGTDFIGLDGRLIKVFAPLSPPYPLHWAPNLMFVQPEFEPILRAGAERYPCVTVRPSTRALAVEQDEDGVRLALRPVDGGAEETVSGRYLVACDGAASPVRKQLGIAQDSLDFDEWWTVVDAWLQRPTPLPRRTTQFCWPSAPTTYVVGPGALRRWELKLMPGETPEDHADADRLRARLAPFVDPEAIELWRVATYRFHALVARHWRRGRIFLAGDAAHQMPPFLAQGLCSGIRDVANLGWKLSEVIAGALPAAILDSYEAERKPHIRHLVATTKEIGEIIGELDVEVARRRDARLGDALDAGTAVTVRQKLIPDLEAGLIARGPDGRPAPAAGSLFPQPVVREHAGGRALLDDLAPEHFLILTAGETRCGAAAAAVMERLGAVHLHLGKAGVPPALGEIAEEGELLRDWLAQRSARAALVRPDKYVFGLASDSDGLESLCRDLLAAVFGAPAHQQEATP